MLALIGIYAFDAIHLMNFVLLISTPISWYVPVRFAWIHLSFTIAERFIWWSVLAQLLAGLPDNRYFTNSWTDWELGFVFYGPVILSDLVTIAAKQTTPLRIRVLDIFLFFVPAVGLPVIAFMLAPYWFVNMQSRFNASLSEATQGRPYCISTDWNNIVPSDLLARALLLDASSKPLDPVPFRALLQIAIKDKTLEMYWSFREARFIPLLNGWKGLSQRPCSPKAPAS